MPDRRLRAAVLISGRGTNMLALAEAAARPDYPVALALVIANRADAIGLETARALGLATLAIPHRAYAGREAFDAALSDALEAHGVELVILAGFMRILTPGFIRRWEGRILNIHPSLLPKYPGLDTHARALAAGMMVHGCTVHEVTPELDAGPILGQAVIPVRPGDTPDSLAARVLPMEHRLYPAVLRRFAAGDRTPLALFP